ncbi:MAG: hypothetical protein SFU25_03960, partial [Candidatus Caenarcaniphilales bacterium]|nr:hypothetical protein [Candidatus Caenarcaniphilales bacterium]
MNLNIQVIRNKHKRALKTFKSNHSSQAKKTAKAHLIFNSPGASSREFHPKIIEAAGRIKGLIESNQSNPNIGGYQTYGSFSPE